MCDAIVLHSHNTHRELMVPQAHKDQLDRREIPARGEHLVPQDDMEKL